MTLKIPRVAVLLVLIALSLPSLTSAQQSATPKRILVLYWYDKGFPGHVKWDRSFQEGLEAAPPETIEYYPEYLEANRFPGENQSQVLHDYLKQKYAGKSMDVVVAQSDTSLAFLLKYRDDLFPHTPIVFYVGSRPRSPRLATEPDVTGLVVFSSYRKTLDLALRLHPLTKQVFVISGTVEHDKRYEVAAHEELVDYEKRIQINYLTDLPLNELTLKTKNLSEDSIILYVWQQAYNEHGKLLESLDVLSSIAGTTPVPIYGMSGPIISSGTRGMIGGYVYTPEAGASRIAELVLRIANGERARDIPIENVATIPMFDWRELRRWGITEDSLPAGSVIRFKEVTFWQQYKWTIIGILTVLLLQTALIAVLLIERRRRQWGSESLAQLNTELEHRIEARSAALDNKCRELETFAYSVAHDLKAPLRGIDGYSRLLLEDHAKNLDDEGRSFLETIKTSSEEMNQLIDDLLEYSRFERREFKSDVVELQPLIATLVEQKKREATEPRINFVVNGDGGTVIADVNGLTQSLKKCVDNAVKFTGQVAQPRIEVGSKETTTNCLLWVRDNGIGFDMRYHDRIFDIFQRLNAAEDFPGTGVGLAIVRKAMERMGGRAWAESEPGQGTTFFLGDSEVIMNDSVSPILLVEDRATDLDLTKRAFARQRLLNPVQVARNGEDALAYIDRWEAGEALPVFILLDLRLPKISGLEVLRRLKNHPKFFKIPVIVLTTSAEDQDIEEAYALGCNSYIVKPVEFSKFIEVASQIEVYWCAMNTTPR